MAAVVSCVGKSIPIPLDPISACISQNAMGTWPESGLLQLQSSKSVKRQLDQSIRETKR